MANHQNALLDALLIATQFNFKPYFLTRASVFSIPWVVKFLSLIRMVPIYRTRDGFSSIRKNDKTFSICEQVLARKGKILIFPEGNHSLKRNLRPLNKRIYQDRFQHFHFPLWMAWKALMKRTQDPVFYATVKFFIGILGVPLLYGFEFGLGFIAGHLNSSLILILLQMVSLVFNKNNFNDYELRHHKDTEGQKEYQS